MIDQFVNSGFFYPVLVGVSAIIGIIVFKIFLDYKAAENSMEEEALSEVIRGEIKQMTDMFGYEVKKDISVDLNKIGRIEKAYTTQEVPAQNLKKNQTEKEDQEEENEKDENEDKFKKYYYFKVRPNDFTKRVAARLTDDTMAFEKYTDYLRVSEDYVQDGEVVSVSSEWNPTKFGGVWLQEIEAPHYIRDRTYKSILEKSLETAKETVRAINELNLNYVESEMKMKAIKEMQGGDLQEQMEKFMEGN
jgi:hypothetical protein